MRERLWLITLASLCLVPAVGLGLPPFPPLPIAATVTRVLDGTTVEVRVDRLPSPAPAGLSTGQSVRVQYLGVGSPGEGSVEAPVAKALNAALVQGKPVYLELDTPERDPDGNLLAYVYLDPDGRLMVNLILMSTDLFSIRAEPAATRYAAQFAHAAAMPAPATRGACSPAVPWTEARSRIGDTLCVEGPVEGVGTGPGGDLFINLGRPFPDPGRFTLFIPARHVGKFEAAFGTRFWTSLTGTMVQAQGEVKLYQGAAEIVLSEPDSLFLLP